MKTLIKENVYLLIYLAFVTSIVIIGMTIG